MPPDLEVRLHAPISQAVIVRVAGTVDADGAVLLARRVAQQLDRADHVVLDLSDVHVLHCGAVDPLIELHRYTHARKVQLHLAGAGHDPGGLALRHVGAERVLDLVESADARIALLRHDILTMSENDGATRY